MGTSIIHLVKLCGPAYTAVFCFFLVASFAAVIANIKNLSKARQYISSNSQLPDGFKKFLFWPKVLKGLGVLSFMASILATAMAFEAVFQYMLSRPNASSMDMYQGAYESLVILCFGTALSIILFSTYYIFRTLLHGIRHHK
ncbi:MAG: hypothetical protein HY811_08000 [Planctomycetes bacterium]|nr:hypothetical protein [Planctomycetota bacterium]